MKKGDVAGDFAGLGQREEGGLGNSHPLARQNLFLVTTADVPLEKSGCLVLLPSTT